MKNSDVEGDLKNSGGRNLEFSEKNINMWLRDHSCDILAKNVAAFALFQNVYLGLNLTILD